MNSESMVAPRDEDDYSVQSVAIVATHERISPGMITRIALPNLVQLFSEEFRISLTLYGLL